MNMAERRKAFKGETIIIRHPRKEAMDCDCYKRGDEFEVVDVTASGVKVHSEKSVPESMRWDYRDDRTMFVEDWEYRIKGINAEIDYTIVIVDPIASEGWYDLGDKFKVLDSNDFGVKVAIDGCNDEFLWWNGEPNTAFIAHEEYEVLRNGKDN